jgi:heme oxygenase (biliverdin-IX-beta and delta-forming)
MHDLKVTEPAHAELPAWCADWNLLGVFYVLEGASLGARLLQRQVLALGLNADFGARHLATQVASPWADFVSRLETCSDAEIPAVVSSANSTFQFAADAMEAAARD